MKDHPLHHPTKNLAIQSTILEQPTNQASHSKTNQPKLKPPNQLVNQRSILNPTWTIPRYQTKHSGMETIKDHQFSSNII